MNEPGEQGDEAGTNGESATPPPGLRTTAAAPRSKDAIPAGYRRVVMNGEERFCRTDTETGSRVKKDEICLTRDELNAEQEPRGWPRLF